MTYFIPDCVIDNNALNLQARFQPAVSIPSLQQRANRFLKLVTLVSAGVFFACTTGIFKLTDGIPPYASLQRKLNMRTTNISVTAGAIDLKSCSSCQLTY
jgi:hypothetical protein